MNSGFDHRDRSRVHQPAGDARSRSIPDCVSLDGDWSFRYWFGDAPLLVPSDRLPDGSLTCPHRGFCTDTAFRSTPTSSMPFSVDCYPAIPLPDEGADHARIVPIPQEWAGQRIILRVGAAESTLEVSVDGHPIGFSTDSRLPAEFDLTDHVNARRRRSC